MKIKDVLKLLDALHEINSRPLKDIEWVDEFNRTIPVPKWMIDEYSFTGMSNAYFVRDFYNELNKMANGEELTYEEVFGYIVEDLDAK